MMGTKTHQHHLLVPLIATLFLLILILPASAGITKSVTQTFVPVYEADVNHANTSWENWSMFLNNNTQFGTTTVTASSAARIIGLQSGTWNNVTPGSPVSDNHAYTKYYRMIYTFDFRSIPTNATITDGYLSINVSENSTKLGHTQIIFTRVRPHNTRGQNTENELFTDATALSASAYNQWLNVNSAGESNMTAALEINKTPINRRWNFTLTDHGIDEINNHTFRNTAMYGNYTVFMGRLGFDASNYTITPTAKPEWHYNMQTQVSIYSYRLFDWNTTPMLVLNYTMVESPTTPCPPSTSTGLFDDAVPFWTITGILLCALVYILYSRRSGR